MNQRALILAALVWTGIGGRASSDVEQPDPLAGQRVLVSQWVVEFKTDSDIVDRGRLGEVLDVAKVQGDWLWIKSKGGWINKNNVVALDRAVDHFTKRVEDSKTAEAYHQRGVVWAALGNYEKSIADFDVALTMQPRDAAVLNERGNAYRQLGRLDEALADFDKVIESGVRHPALYTNRGLVWHDRGDDDKALADYNAAIKLDPKFAPAWEAGGTARRANGQFSKAIDNYTEAIRHAPEFHRALNNLAWLLATCSDQTLRDGERAIELATKAGELTGFQDADYLDSLAAALAEAGRFDEAVKRAEEALKVADEGNRANISTRLQTYKTARPFHESSLP